MSASHISLHLLVLFNCCYCYLAHIHFWCFWSALGMFSKTEIDPCHCLPPSNVQALKLSHSRERRWIGSDVFVVVIALDKGSMINIGNCTAFIYFMVLFFPCRCTMRLSERTLVPQVHRPTLVLRLTKGGWGGFPNNGCWSSFWKWDTQWNSAVAWRWDGSLLVFPK